MCVCVCVHPEQKEIGRMFRVRRRAEIASARRLLERSEIGEIGHASFTGRTLRPARRHVRCQASIPGSLGSRLRRSPALQLCSPRTPDRGLPLSADGALMTSNSTLRGCSIGLPLKRSFTSRVAASRCPATLTMPHGSTLAAPALKSLVTHCAPNR